jgi:hypothetical protein
MRSVIVSVATAHPSIALKMRSRHTHRDRFAGVSSSPVTSHGGTPHERAMLRME